MVAFKVHHPCFRMGFVSMKLCMFLFLGRIFLSSLVLFLKIRVCPFGLVFPKVVMSLSDLYPLSNVFFHFSLAITRMLKGFMIKSHGCI